MNNLEAITIPNFGLGPCSAPYDLSVKLNRNTIGLEL